MEMAPQMLLALGVPAALWLLLRWFQHRGVAGFPKSVKHLEVIERVSLTAQHSLHLVRCDGKKLIVASSPGGCTLLEASDECDA